MLSGVEGSGVLKWTCLFSIITKATFYCVVLCLALYLVENGLNELFFPSLCRTLCSLMRCFAAKNDGEMGHIIQSYNHWGKIYASVRIKLDMIGGVHWLVWSYCLTKKYLTLLSFNVCVYLVLLCCRCTRPLYSGSESSSSLCPVCCWMSRWRRM